jgi:VWFA-related protein
MRIFWILSALAPLLVGQTQDEADRPIFRTEVSLVSVDAKVKARDGKNISGLTAEDFVIIDEGEAQKVTNFGREDTPIEALLVLDVSPAMRPFLLELTPRVSDTLTPLRKGDQVGVLLYATHSEVVQPLTSDLSLIPRRTVNTIYKDVLGQSALMNEALIQATELFKERPRAGRRTIIVITTNQGVRNKVPDDQVISAILGSDTVLNAIIVGETEVQARTVGSFQNPHGTPPDVLRFAKSTGGDVVTGEAPAAALRRLMESATTRYSLQYPMPSGATGFGLIGFDLE